MRNNRAILLYAIVYLLILFVLVSCGTATDSNPTLVPAPSSPPTLSIPTEATTTVRPESGSVESGPSNASTPIMAHLTLSKVPLLNEAVDLTFTISSVLDAPGTNATILLPSGAFLVGGDLEWTGDLRAGEPQVLQATIQFTEEGNLTIEGKASRPLEGGDSWGDAAFIYLHVSEENSFVGFATPQPPNTSEEGVPTPPSVNPSP